MWNIFFFNIFLTIKRIFFQLRQKFLFTKRVDIVIIIKNIKQVQEIIQFLIDQIGGSYLNITKNNALYELFRDPCPGYPKDLRIQYEVRGKGYFFMNVFMF